MSNNLLIPNSTQVPNAYIDICMAFFTPAEFKVLVYLMRRTFGFQKVEDEISLSQFTDGIVTRKGERMDYGTGLSTPAVRAALRILQRFGFVIRARAGDRGHNSALWRLQTDSSKVDMDGFRAWHVAGRPDSETGFHSTDYTNCETELHSTMKPSFTELCNPVSQNYETELHHKTKRNQVKTKRNQEEEGAIAPPSAPAVPPSPVDLEPESTAHSQPALPIPESEPAQTSAPGGSPPTGKGKRKGGPAPKPEPTPTEVQMRRFQALTGYRLDRSRYDENTVAAILEQHTDEEARKFYEIWCSRVNPTTGKPYRRDNAAWVIDWLASGHIPIPNANGAGGARTTNGRADPGEPRGYAGIREYMKERGMI